MNTLLSLLLLVANNSLNPDVNYDIAITILKNYNQLDKLTLSSLAKESKTSVTSVKKFCEMLGCSNFTDFKYLLVSTNQIRKKQIGFRINKTSEDKVLQLIKDYAPISFNIEKYKNDIENLADLIYQSPKVIILGACFPNALSLSFQEDLITMGKLSYSYPVKDNFMSIPESPDALILVLSITGNIYRSLHNNFTQLEAHFNDIAVISGVSDILSAQSNPYIKIKIDLPLDEDDEIGNVFILETLRYLKAVYFRKYIKKF